VALAGVGVYVFISELILAIDNVFSAERVIFVEWVIHSKAVSIDSQRPLCAVRQQESNLRFVGGFRRVNVGLSYSTISGDKHWWFDFMIRFTAVRGQVTRVRRPVVTLAALSSQQRRTVRQFRLGLLTMAEVRPAIPEIARHAGIQSCR